MTWISSPNIDSFQCVAPMSATRPVYLFLQPDHVFPPRDEVVDLLDLDASAERGQLGLELPAALQQGRRPDLRGDDRRCPDRRGLQRMPEHFLGPPVHRRGIDESNARRERLLDDRSRAVLRLGRDVEDGPRAEPDDGHLEVGTSEPAKLQQA
jgi:hypothetical protein